MSVSGFFLMVFLCVHLVINLLTLFGQEAYNAACYFMDTNPIIKIMVPVLALGFFVHIIYAILLTYQNMRARGSERYAVTNKGAASSWASRNMFVLGLIVLGFIGIHLINFWSKMQFAHFVGADPNHDPYTLVTDLFRDPLYVVIYIVWFVALWFHLTHGFWSAFQSIGVNNNKWLPRLQCVAKIYATVIAVGFAIIPLFFLFGLDK